MVTMDESDVSQALQPRLSWRGKVARGVVAAGAVILTLAIIASASGLGLAQSTWSRLAQALLAPAPHRMTSAAIRRYARPARLAAGAWQQIPLPVAGDTYFTYAPSTSDPANVLVCASGTYAPTVTASEPPIELWHTRDSGAHWTKLPLPLTTGIGCNVQAAADDPQRVVLTVDSAHGPSTICPWTAAYLSADGGETWKDVLRSAIAPPSNFQVLCAALITAHHLFFWFWSSSSDPRGIQVTLLERSDDDGQNWMRADNGFGSYSITVQASSGDVMLAAARPASNPGASATLWVTHDAGRTWQRVGPIPADSDWMLASQEPGIVTPTAGHPLYGLVDEQIPAALFQVRALQTADGLHWTALPPLPAPGTGSGRPGISNALGVDASGRFLAFGVDPVTGVPADYSGGAAVFDKGQWLWAWDPHTQRWSVAAAPLSRPWPQHCSELCWSAALSWASESGRSGNGSFLWVSSRSSANGGLYRVYLPAA